MTDFFTQPILNSPYAPPSRHWELDADGRPTNQIIERRRRAEFVSAVPGATSPRQETLDLDAAPHGLELQTAINELRAEVDRWRALPNPADWKVTPETERLLRHWRSTAFTGLRPFFCQVEAAEVAIWLAEVGPKSGAKWRRFLDRLEGVNRDANPDLFRLALKLATGAGKTTVMAMLIAWQVLNAVRRPNSKNYSKGFLIVAPGITIRDRLRVLQPNDPETYYRDRGLVPSDMLSDMGQAKIVITNYHAFKRRERIQLSAGGRQALAGHGEGPETLETEGQMVQRVLGDLMGMKGIVVINDEAHHCYGHYKRTFDEWQIAGVEVPPVFIVVCANTVASEQVFEYISGYERTDANEQTDFHPGRFELFRNHTAHGDRLDRPNTLLIDSLQIDGGDAIDDAFRRAAADEIERFRREKAQREGPEAARTLTDADILREAMNTAGRKDRLGGQLRCVVSVGMLTEGWDASTVTHILGLRAFGSRLLCEQVMGRALRRLNYEQGPDGLFGVEYADIMGIDGLNLAPQDAVSAPVVRPRAMIRVEAVSPDRDAAEIVFPRVEGYRVELPDTEIAADWSAVEPYVLTQEKVGPCEIVMQGVVGAPETLTLDHLRAVRTNEIILKLASHLVMHKLRDADDAPNITLFPKIKPLVRHFLDHVLDCRGGTVPAQLMHRQLADEVADITHLGQILTYLAGLDVKTVIWVATGFRDAHLSAIKWLNDSTVDPYAFFAVRLRVVRIGDSSPAPIFDVLARPNQWERRMQKVARETTGEASPHAGTRRAFWTRYLERHPEDETRGVKVRGVANSWLRPRRAEGLLMSLYRAATGEVGVFLRGPKGMTPAEIQTRFAPHAARFSELVGGCRSLGDDANHPLDTRRFSPDPAEWDAAIDWLHARAHAFADAADEIFGEDRG